MNRAISLLLILLFILFGSWFFMSGSQPGESLENFVINAGETIDSGLAKGGDIIAAGKETAAEASKLARATAEGATEAIAKGTEAVADGIADTADAAAHKVAKGIDAAKGKTAKLMQESTGKGTLDADAARASAKIEALASAAETEMLKRSSEQKPAAVVRFHWGSDELTEEAKTALTQAAKASLSKSKNKIMVVGYTDNQGPAVVNKALSKKRAEIVALYLADQGIDSSRVQSIAQGAASPIATNETALGRWKNRRVEVVVSK